jgi:glycosyltransferase domain-containing protein
MLKDTTIIIPTFNRHKFLKILIRYLFEFKISCPIIIADGSNKKNLILNKKIIDEHNQKNNNQIYHLVDQSNFEERLYNAIKLVKTYCCKINTDDDFFSKSFIENSTNELKNNKSYSALTGYQISYYSKNKDYHFAPANEILENNPYKRIMVAINNTHLWSVYRTKELKLIFLNALDSMPIGTHKKSELNNWIRIRIFGFYMRAYTALLGNVKNSKCCENITIYHENNWANKHKNFSLSNILSTSGLNFFFRKIIDNICKDFKLDKRKATTIVLLTLTYDKQTFKQSNIIEKISYKLKNFYYHKLEKYILFFIDTKKDLKEVKKIINYINLSV